MIISGVRIVSLLMLGLSKGMLKVNARTISMVEADSKLWDRLYFRDYLKKFPTEAKRYEELKQSLSEKYPNDRVAYTAGKAEFVVSVTESAKQYYGTQPNNSFNRSGNSAAFIRKARMLD